MLDYDLERGDGLSLCLRLKHRAPAPAVVIYSGYAGPGLAFLATLAQADAVVGKAQPVEALLATIRRLAAGERLLAPPAPSSWRRRGWRARTSRSWRCSPTGRSPPR